MNKYLIKVVEQFRIESEQEVKDFIEKEKKNPAFELVKYTSESKEHKTKGEVDDAWFRVTLTKVYNNEREPLVAYEEDGQK